MFTKLLMRAYTVYSFPIPVHLLNGKPAFNHSRYVFPGVATYTPG
jgi:hypothetical protein